MTERDFILRPQVNLVEKGSVSWSSPSNIALVKYWGKKEHQIPANPSISFTLDSCRTETKLKYARKTESDNFSFDVFFEGVKKDSFKPKIETFFKRIEKYVPFVKSYHFTIETSNSFPHSSGIASSASGMSALALCLMSIEKQMVPDMLDAYFNNKASFLARLGSGSASRSIEGPIVVWGTHKHIDNSSDLIGVKYPFDVHQNFNNYRDAILLVDKGEKQVSSTVGHNLMNGHPFAEQRFIQAYQNIVELMKVFKSGDLNHFCQIVENEALTLHAMMLTSNPSFILMKPNTLSIIENIRTFREANGVQICFTLDAGANVHLLYPDNYAQEVEKFIDTDLVAYCQNGHYICDRIGFGAKQLPI